MNFLQLSQRLRQECGGTGEGPASVSNQVGEYKQFVDWVNRAYMEIQQDRNDWGWLWARDSLPVTIDQSLYALASPTPDLTTFRIDGRLIDHVPYADWNHFILRSGKPSAFTLNPARELQFGVLPDADYLLTYDYFKTPALLVGNSDIPLLPPRYHMLIVFKAMTFYGFYENAGEQIQSGVAQYENMLADLDRDTLPLMRPPEALG